MVHLIVFKKNKLLYILFALVSKGRLELCGQTSTFTLDDNTLAKELATPGYPDSYNTDEQCKTVIKVDVSRPFTVTIVSTVEDCHSSLPYNAYPKTENTPLYETSTCSSSGGVNRHITAFKYNGSEDKVKRVRIQFNLLQGSGNGFSISVLGK